MWQIFPPKNLEKIRCSKYACAGFFSFFFSRIIIHLSINFYFYFLVVLYLFIFDKNKVFSICVIFIVFNNVQVFQSANILFALNLII